MAGKGGVGKTTVTAVVARAAADAGRRVLVVELDGKPALHQLVADVPLEAIDAPTALDEYLRDHGFARIAKRLSSTGVIDVVGTAAPGIDDIVVLGKIKQFERSGDWDTIVVDGPAAGHAVTFLMAAAGLLDAVRGGPIKTQATDVLDLLRDPKRCQVVLVTVPETTPVNEVVETAYALEERVGVQLGPVVVNGVDQGVELPDRARIDALSTVDGDDRDDRTRPVAGDGASAGADRRSADLDHATLTALCDAARHRIARRGMQGDEIERLRRELALPQVHLPLLPVAGLDADDVGALSQTLAPATGGGTP